MNKIKRILCISLLLMTIGATAQNEIQLQEIEIINLGDGQYYGHQRHDKNKPIEGTVRLITGVTSEYIDCKFVKGYPEGEWKYFVNNRPKEVYNYKNGYKDGLHTQYYADGQTKETESTYQKGEVEGKVTRYESDGEISYVCEMKNGMLHGLEQRLREGKVQSQANYVNGKIEGKTFNRISSNRTDYRIDANYKNGMLESKYTETFDDGVLKSAGQYTRGKKTGRWEYRSKEDMPRLSEDYKDDGCVRRITYYNNANVEVDKEMADGSANGITRKYTLEGELKSEENFVKGRQVGKQKLLITSNVGKYYEVCTYNARGRKDGQYTEIFKDNEVVKTKGQYINGHKDGEWQYAGLSGKVNRIEIYEKGVLKETKTIQN